MRAVGLITEYNPFHNGHLHHLEESRRASGCEVVVAVMSGHFLQRGEPALVDKWVRAEMALRAGGDLVVELPFPFACNSAPHFARGAVQVLEALGVTDLCFGSEGGSLADLQRCADFLLEREGEIREGTSTLLRKGRTYPDAREALVHGLAGVRDAAILKTPNNILGIEYLKALRQTGSAIVPHTVLRIGAGYHEEGAVRGIASATGIRRMLAAGEDVAPFLPPAAFSSFAAALAAGRDSDPDSFYRLLAARILIGPDSLAGSYLVEDGLENRLYAAALEARCWEDLVQGGKARQFTRTRIQRTLCHILNRSSAADMNAFLTAGPLYLHLLAASEKGRALLASTRKRRTLPLVANFSRVWPVLKSHYGTRTENYRLAEGMLQADLRATRLYTLLMRNWVGNRNRDFFEPTPGA